MPAATGVTVNCPAFGPDAIVAMPVHGVLPLLELNVPLYPDSVATVDCAFADPVAVNERLDGVSTTAPAAAVGVGVGVGVGDAVGDAVGVGVGDTVGDAVGDGDGVGVVYA